MYQVYKSAIYVMREDFLWEAVAAVVVVMVVCRGAAV